MKYAIYSCHVEISFESKPESQILNCLKANGFRWNPAMQVWYRRKASGVHNIIGAIQKMMRPANEPDGQCWECKQPGLFRNYGPATPVLCDACNAAFKAKRESLFESIRESAQ